ncbi:MAG: hypothetical protein PV344_05525, partial [Anaplasma sp.]|nr:hypothetical protein [Anaplasma sp.]
MLTYCPNCSRGLFIANHRRSRNSRKLGPRGNLVVYSMSQGVVFLDERSASVCFVCAIAREKFNIISS